MRPRPVAPSRRSEAIPLQQFADADHPAGLFMQLKSVVLVSHMQNPSWCFDVMTMYVAPRLSATSTKSSALNFSAVNFGIACFR